MQGRMETILFYRSFQNYSSVIHSVPPFYLHNSPARQAKLGGTDLHWVIRFTTGYGSVAAPLWFFTILGTKVPWLPGYDIRSPTNNSVSNKVDIPDLDCKPLGGRDLPSHSVYASCTEMSYINVTNERNGMITRLQFLSLDCWTVTPNASMVGHV